MISGMGKSTFAGAVAKHVHQFRPCTFFNVSASSLLSMWQSETEKTLLSLFEKSESYGCSLIFLDEASFISLCTI